MINDFLDALYNSKADGENPPALFIVCIGFLLLTPYRVLFEAKKLHHLVFSS